jgi:hypothetical protein
VGIALASSMMTRILSLPVAIQVFADIRPLPPVPDPVPGDKGWGSIFIVGVMAIVAVSVVLIMAWRRRRS